MPIKNRIAFKGRKKWVCGTLNIYMVCLSIKYSKSKVGRINKFSHVWALINLIVTLEINNISSLSTIHTQSEMDKKGRWPVHAVFLLLWSSSYFSLQTFYPVKIMLLAIDL